MARIWPQFGQICRVASAKNDQSLWSTSLISCLWVFYLGSRLQCSEWHKSDPSGNRKPRERVSGRETRADWRSTFLISVSSLVEIKVVKVWFQFQVVCKNKSAKSMSGQLEAAAAACLTSPPQVAVFRHRWTLLEFSPLCVFYNFEIRTKFSPLQAVVFRHRRH